MLLPDAVTPTSSPIKVRDTKRAGATGRLPAAAAMPPLDANAAEAARGWLTH